MRKHTYKRRYLSLLLVIFLGACTTMIPVKKGVYHTVGPGEDVWRIANVYEVDPKVVAEVNGIYNPEDINVGDTLFIPGAKKTLVVPPPTIEELAAKLQKGAFVWPVQGMIFSLFGPRWGRLHEGIDISAPRGTPIVAAKDGIVIAAERKQGYGNTVEIKHSNGFTTRYAHLSETVVKEGDTVKGGQVIGSVGCTGRCTGPHCHFEIHYHDVPLNPLYFLP
ncbi:MAG: LysM peptidoglycan-binding domain-containing M23 family metallopeptidase [Deltaproteobacteria bacterium]|nr:LysM peptidoglycan-binding domain-containing M23 family metallopeptidase [Candidatus Zymogenaceae bacterium]